MGLRSRGVQIAARISRYGGASHSLPGEAKGRGRPDAKLAAQSKVAAVQLDQSLSDRQAETGTLMFAGEVIGNLLERLKNSFDLFRRNTDPGISEREAKIAAFMEQQLDLYMPSRVCELNRI